VLITVTNTQHFIYSSWFKLICTYLSIINIFLIVLSYFLDFFIINAWRKGNPSTRLRRKIWPEGDVGTSKFFIINCEEKKFWIEMSLTICMISKYVKVVGNNSAEFFIYRIGHERIDICNSRSRLVSKSK